MNLPGWEGARMEYWDGSQYIPIACITSRSEQNSTNTVRKVNVCTEGKAVTKAISISRTVSITGEVADADSLDDMKGLQDSLQEQTFKVYRTAGGGSPQWFKGTITNVSADYNAEEETADSTFSMDIDINGDYLETDPNL